MFNQLHTKVMEYWCKDLKNQKVTNNILKVLEIPANLTWVQHIL